MPFNTPRTRILALVLLSVLSPAAVAQSATPSIRPAACGGDPAFRQLDFWVGDWVVFVGERQVGTNRITAVLNGCAVREEWTASDGSQGQSLFYIHPSDRRWRQVWVTQQAMNPGGLKEKAQVDVADPAVRFQGTIVDTAGRSWLDRTTLTPLPDGTVRQHIEISTDGGATWRTTFDAVYRRRRGAAN